MLEMIVFSLIGVGMGVATGLVPGLHVNNTLPFMVSLLPLVGDPMGLAAMIVSMSFAQIFVGFVPSVFLGAPEADTSLSTLPGHKLLREGSGIEAIKITALGGLLSLAASVAVMLALSPYFDAMYELSRPYIQYALLAVLCTIVISNRGIGKLKSLITVALSGTLGVIALGSPASDQQTILFPTLAGLFGISILLTSLSQRTKVPEQSESKIGMDWKDMMKSVILGSVAGLAVGFLPAIGVSQAAAAFQYVGGMGEARAFLSSLSGINVANEVFSINSVYLIGNPRSGASVAIEGLIPELEFGDVALFLSVGALAAGAGAFAAVKMSRLFCSFISKVNYRLLSMCVIAFLVAMVAYTTGLYGTIVATTAAAIGVLCEMMGARRSDCMSVLIVPSILFFSGLSPTVSGLLGL